MTSPAALQRAYDALVVGFALPLLEGGTSTLSHPLSPGCAGYFRLASPSTSDADFRMHQALHRGASGLASIERLDWPSPGLLAMLASLHDLLFLTDPSLNRAFARGSRKEIVAWTRGWMELAALPRTRGEVLARHVVITRARALQRRDVVVKNWAYTYRFFGRSVPANVVALPRLRFVRQDAQVRSFSELFSNPRDPGLAALGLPSLWGELVQRSPLTALLEAASSPGFRFSTSTLSVLSDRALRGLVAGELVANEWKAASHLAKAAFDPSLAAAPALASIAHQLLLELHLVAAIASPPASSRAAPPRSALEDAGVQRYLALFVAHLEDPRAFHELVALAPAHRALIQARAETFRASVTPAALDEARARLGEAQRYEPTFLPS